jgi:hypothetical protein
LYNSLPVLPVHIDTFIVGSLCPLNIDNMYTPKDIFVLCQYYHALHWQTTIYFFIRLFKSVIGCGYEDVYFDFAVGDDRAYVDDGVHSGGDGCGKGYGGNGDFDGVH